MDTNENTVVNSNPASSKTSKPSQLARLVTYLRGTGREISAAQAKARFGVSNLRARMTEARQDGYRVRTRVNSNGNTSYSISARTTNGSRAGL